VIEFRQRPCVSIIRFEQTKPEHVNARQRRSDSTRSPSWKIAAAGSEASLENISRRPVVKENFGVATTKTCSVWLRCRRGRRVASLAPERDGNQRANQRAASKIE